MYLMTEITCNPYVEINVVTNERYYILFYIEDKSMKLRYELIFQNLHEM